MDVAGSHTRARMAVLAALVFAVLGASLAARASSPTLAPAFADDAGLHVLGIKRYDARDYNVSILSSDLGRPVNVRLLLPAGYDPTALRRYPVLYLFHGTSGRASDWVEAGGAEATTAAYPVITVMPDCGFDGDGGFWFTNWVDRTTTHGPSQFEDFFIKSLIPWVDSNLHTVAQRDGRAVAGLSQGGYGSAEMAARHPDLFASMASFSGAPEIERDPEIFAGAAGVIEAIEVGDDRVPPFSELGNPGTDLINWKGHDPATLITNLRGMSIDLWTGQGVDGPYDPSPNAADSAIEGAVYESTQHFYGHLVAEGIPAYYDDYVYGTHRFGYWARDLRTYVPMMMADFSHPKHPAMISYMSIDNHWSAWGYTVNLSRSSAQEFSALNNGTPTGFSFSGTGTATVSTPSHYRPGELMSVTVRAPGGNITKVVSADSAGRVTIELSLGMGADETVSIRPQ